jgi:hypothetical protein
VNDRPSAISSTPPSSAQAVRIAGVFEPHLERLAWVMREKYGRVLAANRFFEEETGIHNEIGHNNLNDSLSHLGTLFEKAAEMDFQQQANEVHDFEGHLRRSMMESYEKVVRRRLGQIGERWDDHERDVRPLQAAGKLAGISSLEELEALRRKCKNLIEDGRKCKRGHDWDEWERGTESLIEACKTATQLNDRLGQGIQAAQQHREGRRSLRIGVAVAAATLVLGLGGGYAISELTNDDQPQTTTPTPTPPGTEQPEGAP